MIVYEFGKSRELHAMLGLKHLLRQLPSMVASMVATPLPIYFPKIKGRLQWNFRKLFFWLNMFIMHEVLNTKYFFEIFPAFLLFKIGS